MDVKFSALFIKWEFNENEINESHFYSHSTLSISSWKKWILIDLCLTEQNQFRLNWQKIIILKFLILKIMIVKEFLCFELETGGKIIGWWVQLWKIQIN